MPDPDFTVEFLGPETVFQRQDETLSDLLDRLLHVGVVVRGTLVLGVADIDLVRVDLGVLLASASRVPEGMP